MKRKTLKVLAVLAIFLALRYVVGIFFVPNSFARGIVQLIYFGLAVVLGVIGFLLARKGWGEMKDPNFSPGQKIVIGTLFALLLSVAAVYWLGFYMIGGEGDLAGIDYQVAHTDREGNVHLDFTQSDVWVVDWSNLTSQDWVSVSYRSGEFTGGAQKVQYRLYVKNFFGGYEYLDRDYTFFPGESYSSRLPEDRPFATYRILFESSSPNLTGAEFFVTGGTLDPGW